MAKNCLFFFLLWEWSGVGNFCHFFGLLLCNFFGYHRLFRLEKYQDLGHLCKVLEKLIWNGCFEFILYYRRRDFLNMF
jgi:hypothetical protein